MLESIGFDGRWIFFANSGSDSQLQPPKNITVKRFPPVAPELIIKLLSEKSEFFFAHKTKEVKKRIKKYPTFLNPGFGA